MDSNLRRVEFRATWHRVRYQSALGKCCPDALSIRLKGYHVDDLPTPEQHELGGYETWLGTNRVEVHASRKIVAALLDLFGDLR